MPDVSSLAKLDPARLKNAWAAEVDALADHYQFDQKQRDQAKAELADSQAYADIWFQDKETTEKRLKYYHELREVRAIERDPEALSYQRERAASRRKDLDADRKTLIADLDARGAALREAVTKLATPEQRESAGPYIPPRTSLDWVNLSTMWGLVAMGICLMLGLFTRLGALAGAVFLGQIYLSMPPWPGLPPNPMAEGHYFIVNKNLIEMLACLALACLPTGSWIGLDALVFGWIGRGGQEAREHAQTTADDEAPAAPSRAPRTRAEDTGPIPF